MLKHTLFQCQHIGFALAVFCFFTASTASARQQLYGHVPKEANPSSYIGSLESTQNISLSISLPLRNQDELQQFLKDVYNPQSYLYHHFLTPDEFAVRFGPADSDYQAVIDFAKSHNLTVINTYPNHLLVDVQASVSDIQKTFHVNLNRYQRADGSEFHAPDQEPSVDLDIPLTNIGGLENYRVPKPAFSTTELDAQTAKSQKSSARPNNGTGAGGLYLGTDFRTAYFGCVPSLQGAGQTVALVEFDGYTASDITLYKTDAGAVYSSDPPLLSNILLNGFNGKPGSNNGEVALDIEMIYAVAPLAQIYVVEGTSANSILSQIATSPPNHLANQISSSWSYTDGSFGADSISAGLIMEFASQGQSYFQSSGDSGSYIGGLTVPGPMDLTSEMTVVGGTQLTTGGGASYTSETTWNNGAGESGGGICNSSTPVPIPTYQNTSTFIINGASGVNRNIPDVSMVATNIESIATNISGGVTTAGITFITSGTSCAAPLWAGLMVLINEQANSQIKGPMGLLNPYLYNLASGGAYASDFNDISTGNNNATGSGLYPAAAGYDLATGLGSPKCNLINDLVAPLATNTQTFTPTVTRTPTITPTPTNSPTITNTPTPPTTTTSYAYPQPASGQVFICFNSNSAQPIQINVYSFSGQLITSITDNAQNSNQNRIPISLQGIAPGVYFYVIRGSGGVMCTGKFLAVP